ncbi:TetR family transcriptional regulator [[Clostridium] sordellii]|uniref:TetR/AcrR family transcriptional regulator n=1 Tax=Paraclostridium sordellii TaxID=1505 RepID=UPI0005DB3F27|nr:TetR/AcrR family transcriptional regulator [Paeniclostridium sordellii]CEQ08919.1 TetR family transcriptional regulator [[Clostridium] sordellii] [Paeniclostridium sordellii]
MAKQTKEDIILTARDLFNKHGYNSISMRDIANELEISVGNLTYHFKKKEDLIEEVVNYKHRNYKKIDVPKSIEDLNTFFINALNIQNENAYYFKHFDQLAQISPKIYNLQRSTIKELHELLRKSFETLVDLNLMKKFSNTTQMVNIIDCILTILIYKPVSCKEFNEDDSIKNTIDCLWSILFMYLTNEGQNIYYSINS